MTDPLSLRFLSRSRSSLTLPEIEDTRSRQPIYVAKSTFTAIGRAPDVKQSITNFMGHSVPKISNQTSRFAYLLVIASSWLTFALLFAWSTYW